MQKLPEGVELSVQFYVKSDTEGHEAVVNLKGIKALPSLEEIDTALILKDLPPLADDWRMMTSDEIAAYKASEKDAD